MNTKKERSKIYQLTKDKFLTDDEKATFKANLQNAPTRDRLMMELVLATGGRAQEILNVKKSDLDYQEKAVQIIGLKHSLDRVIPLRHDLFDRLVAWSEGKGPTEHLFDVGYRQFDNIWKQYAPAGKSIKSARHTFAVDLYKRTKDIRLVQVALGHRNISNTLIYAAYVDGLEGLRKALLHDGKE